MSHVVVLGQQLAGTVLGRRSDGIVRDAMECMMCEEADAKELLSAKAVGELLEFRTLDRKVLHFRCWVWRCLMVRAEVAEAVGEAVWVLALVVGSPVESVRNTERMLQGT